jgi:nucleoside-diphosphate-sugar epimerase
MGAEQTVLAKGGTVLRLAGLYTLERGAHNYWLTQKGEVGGRPDGIINLLHYDDAAGSVVAALTASSDDVQGKVFLISDSNPLTRYQICESSQKAAKYRDTTTPKFLGSSEKDPIGKIYDGSASNKALNWSPRYPSFDEFMNSQK